MIVLLVDIEAESHKEVFRSAHIRGLPNDDVEECADEVTYGENDNDDAEYAEGIVHHDLSHDVVVVFVAREHWQIIILHSLQIPLHLRFVVGFYQIIKLSGVEEKKNFLQA